jgi:predicted GIY-YIG superfamily endonuclease
MGQRMIYLIHLLKPFKHARHYLGSTVDLDKRITDHLCGQGARLMEVVTQAGIEWKVVRTWKGSRKDERKLKNQHNTPRLCPVCNPKIAGRKRIKASK